MLDDLAYIHERDVDDALGTVGKQAQLLEQQFEVPTGLTKPANIVYAGMGGSALAALMAQTWPPTTVPFTVVRNYELPTWVNQDTLVICCSVSGNTEEALAALTQAEQKAAQMVVIASGGKLQTLAQEKNYPFMLLPNVGQPRYTVLANFKALLTILDAAHVLEATDWQAELTTATGFLQAELVHWAPDVATKDNLAKQIAQELIGKSVVIYSGPKLAPAAYKWKISCNENAKHIAWVNQYPEFNHNEILGWTKQPTNKPYAVIDLRSNLEHSQIQKRFKVTAQLLSGMRPEPIVIDAKGETVLQQLLWTAALGDFASIYLALLNNLNPTPVELMEKLKKMLTQD